MDAPEDMENWDQESDVLDTWFSSALWPFSTLGWPNKTEDFERYFPTDCLVTGYDIIFFWVSRMIFQSLEMTKDKPFKNVVIHGLVRDELGRKMSKSLGNGVDPMDVIEQYGADALRYFLTTNSTPGQDMRYIDEKVQAASNYLNKIWNSARYVLSILHEGFSASELNKNDFSPLDQWVINRLEETIKNVTANMDKFDFNAASSHLYNFVYDDFCGQYLEMSKVALNGDNEKTKETTYQVLYFILKNIILLIYPYTPFIAEEMYQNIPGHKGSVMLETYPIYNKDIVDASRDNEVDMLFTMIKDVRNYKIENKLAPNAKLDLKVALKINAFSDFFTYLKRFTFSDVEVVNSLQNNGDINIYNDGSMLITNEAGKADLIEKLSKDIENIKSEMTRCEKMLNNPGFTSKAPAEKIALEKSKLEQHRANLAELEKKLASLK